MVKLKAIIKGRTGALMTHYFGTRTELAYFMRKKRQYDLSVVSVKPVRTKRKTFAAKVVSFTGPKTPLVKKLRKWKKRRR